MSGDEEYASRDMPPRQVRHVGGGERTRSNAVSLTDFIITIFGRERKI